MKKLLNKKGFTLMEMLIVVAIIVILVAISVPTFSANLNEAKVATDAANLRAAKSAAQIYAMDNTPTADAQYHYDIDSGKIESGAGSNCGECSKHKDKAYISVKFDANGNPTVAWSTADDCE